MLRRAAFLGAAPTRVYSVLKAHNFRVDEWASPQQLWKASVVGVGSEGLSAPQILKLPNLHVVVAMDPTTCIDENGVPSMVTTIKPPLPLLEHWAFDTFRQVAWSLESGSCALTCDLDCAGPCQLNARVNVGIAGFGQVGELVASMCSSLGVTIVVHDVKFGGALNHPHVPESYQMAPSLEELARRSHILCLHLPMNASTKGIVGQGMFEQMNSVVVINGTSSGLVDMEALEWGLCTHRVECYIENGFGDLAVVDHPEVIQERGMIGETDADKWVAEELDSYIRTMF